MRITSVHTYPVKGGHRLDHDGARVEPWGLESDRRWILVDTDGVGITQREVPALTGLQPLPFDGGLTLRAAGRDDLVVPEPVDGPKEFIRVFKSKTPVPGRVAVEATDWITGWLGRPARLVWQADPTGRTIETHALDSDRVSFADGYPVLLANTASLDAVNDWLVEGGDEPVPMTRFRPNLVVAGARAWAEDDWLGGRLRIGEVTYRAARACARCVVITTDQETGEVGRQPLRALGVHRRVGSELRFAINLIPDVTPGDTGFIRVGDSLTVLP
jgi:uncharacterized protein